MKLYNCLRLDQIVTSRGQNWYIKEDFPWTRYLSLEPEMEALYRDQNWSNSNVTERK